MASPNSSQVFKYNLYWQRTVDPASAELDMIRHGGQWKKQDGTLAGEGLKFHYKEFIRIVWPWVVQHRWFDLILENYLTHRTIAIIGPASSGKTMCSALMVLVDYFAHPDCTTVICCSTTKERLQDRVWADIIKFFRESKKQRHWLPGNLIEGRLRIITDSRKDSPDGRDFRNGMCFPSGTLVDTPNGPVPIENIQVSDSVINATGIGRVTATHLSATNSLIKISMADGRVVSCTEDHPFLTQFGWKKACELNQSCFILSAYEAMQVLRCNDSRSFQRQILQRVQATENNLPYVRCGVSVKGEMVTENSENLRTILQREITPFNSRNERALEKSSLSCTKEISQSQSGIFGNDCSDEHRTETFIRSPSKNICSDEVDWSQTNTEGWEWNWPYRSGIQIKKDVSRWENKSPNQDWKEKRKWISNLLQIRFRIPRHKTFSGGRWGFPQQPISESKGCKEGQIFIGSWVENIEIQKPSDFGPSGNNQAGYTVHNLSVDSHPSYSVNGLLAHNCGVPCKRGDTFIGIGEFAGIKNKRVRLLGDELSMLAKSFCDAISNLDKNPDFRCIGLGNPKETTDALGILAEPAPHLGGWDSGIDQTFGTKTWATRRENGIAIQLPGDDSPNLDGQLGIPLISQADINRDLSFYGRESVWFTMMDLGRMPRGQGSRRVLTRQLCLKYKAMDEPVWRDDKQTHIAFLDASYRGTGGDRCIFGTLSFGYEVPMDKFSIPDSSIAHSMADKSSNHQIIALKELMIVPIDPAFDDPAEYQIAHFVKKQCEERGIPPEDFFYDAGMRTALVSAFTKVWDSPGETIDFGGTPSDDSVSASIPIPCKDYYSKFVSELWFSVRLTVEAGQVRGFTEDVIMEFASREYGKVGNNKIEVEPKDKVKEKCGRSPDLADAVVCGFFGARQRGFHIARLQPEKKIQHGPDWREALRERAKKLNVSGALEFAS